jgi:hypothetical protein
MKRPERSYETATGTRLAMEAAEGAWAPRARTVDKLLDVKVAAPRAQQAAPLRRAAELRPAAQRLEASSPARARCTLCRWCAIIPCASRGAMRLEFSEPISRKTLALSIQGL